jgi:hypothetical protein
MKHVITQKTFALILCLVLSLSLRAQVSKSVRVETAGTISTLITAEEKYQITNLTVTGDLNGTDIRFIREMAGSDVNDKQTSGTLSELDLSGANIVSGGDFYYDGSCCLDEYYSSKDTIGSYMFSSCAQLTSLKIPNSVTWIGDGAFNTCDRLSSIYIGSNLRLMNDNPFNNRNPALSSIQVSEDNENYCSEDGVLYSKDKTTLIACPSGKSGVFIIPNSVITISSKAFFLCTKLTSISIGTGVTSINYGAFQNCWKLSSVIIPDNVITIGVYSFKDCCSMTSVSFGSGVTTIREGAFMGCSELTSIIIPNNVKNIDDKAFHSCSGVTSVTIGSGISSIGSEAFACCSSLASVVIEYGAASIGKFAFVSCKSLTSVDIASGSIGTSAFAGCVSLSSLHIGSGVTSIGDYAFSNSDKLTTLIIPDNVTSIGKGAFVSCDSLLSVKLGSGITFISDTAFCECRNMSSITIPDCIDSIGADAFYGCSGLTEIHSESLTPPLLFMYQFSYPPFHGVDKSKCKLYVPLASNDAYSTTLYWNDFSNIIKTHTTHNLKYEVINDSASIVGYVSKPVGTLSIDNYIECNSKFYPITSIKDSVFINCDSIEYLKTQWTLRSIGAGAFKNCSNLMEIVLGEYPLPTAERQQTDTSKIKSIGNDFLTSSVMSIGTHAFQNCIWMEIIVVFEDVPPVLGDEVFSGVNAKRGELHIIKGTKAAYAAADQWQDFTDIYEFSVSSVLKNGTSHTTIFTEKNGFVVKGATYGTTITVYSALGIPIKEVNVDSDEQWIQLPTGRIYFVKVGDQMSKVVL